MKIRVEPLKIVFNETPIVVGAVYRTTVEDGCLWLLTRAENGFRWVNLSLCYSHDNPDDEATVREDIRNMRCLGNLVVEDA